jgi:nuclear pore complex protein Nup188
MPTWPKIWSSWCRALVRILVPLPIWLTCCQEVQFILLFHIALASNPTAAEKLASDRVLIAYSNNSITISRGLIEVPLMLRTVLCSWSQQPLFHLRQHHFFETKRPDLFSFTRISYRAHYPWGLEEIEQVITLFYSISGITPNSTHSEIEKSTVLSRPSYCSS